MVFSLGKIFLSDEDILITHHATPKTGTNDIMLPYKLRRFQTSEEPNMANLLNVICKSLYL